MHAAGPTVDISYEILLTGSTGALASHGSLIFCEAVVSSKCLFGAKSESTIFFWSMASMCPGGLPDEQHAP
jgi:hypothetical protein